MIPTDLAARLRVLMEAAVHPLAPVRDVQPDLPDLRTGQRFTANIQNALPDGTYRALVAGKSMTLALPQGAKSGDALELVVVGRNAKSVIATDAGPTPPGGQQGVPGRPAATLSRAGQLIGALIGDADGATPQPTALSRSSPLLAEPPASGSLLAPRLQTAVAESGLFYEAHQAKWIAGQLPATALLREPQSRHAGRPPAGPTPHSQPPAGAAPRAATVGGTHAGAAPVPAAAPAAADPGGVLNHAATELESVALAASRDLPAAARATQAPALPEELAPLVRQQLDVLSNQHVVLAGQLWPNQNLEWEIEDARKERAANDAGNETPRWTTNLRLTLPGLGGIAASLSIEGKKVGVALHAAQAPAAIALRDGGSELAHALEAAGLRLDAIQVDHDSDA